MVERGCVVVGDVVHSRDVVDREALRRDLSDGIEAVNRRVEGSSIAAFAALKGVDEVGGVLETPARSYRAMCEIAESIHPTEIRFAVVQGTVDLGVETGTVAEMDGPAFHEADELLSSLAEAGRYVGLSLDGDRWGPTLLRDLQDLLFAWKYEWTPDQAEVVRQYRRLDSMDAVAARRGVTVQAVSQMLGRARAGQVLAIEADIDRGMTARWGKGS
jgi:hypothetical protein